MPLEKPVFIGFRVKEVSRDTAWLHHFGGFATKVAEICSVRDCMGHAPDGWEERRDFNEAACYDTEHAALATIRPGDDKAYELFAYRMFPLEFHKTGTRAIDVWEQWGGVSTARPPVDPDLHGYVWVGYDLAGGPKMDLPEGRVSMLGFGCCSPLSCNGLAAEYEVNRYCLIDDLEEAIRAGEHFGRTEPEPGPFYLYEVLRKQSDRWTPGA